MVKKLSIILISTVLISLLFCIVYIKSTINLNLPSFEGERTLSVRLSLEKGSVVDEKLINNFFIFFLQQGK